MTSFPVKLLENRTIGIVAALASILLATACEPIPTDFQVANKTEQKVDFIFETDQGSALGIWEHYRSLNVGDLDQMEACWACGMAPDAEFNFDWKITESTRMMFVARSSEDGLIVFKSVFDYDDLVSLNWRVEVVDQR